MPVSLFDVADVGNMQLLFVCGVSCVKIGREATGSPQVVVKRSVSKYVAQRSAARSRPRAEGCNSRPAGPLVQAHRSAAGLPRMESMLSDSRPLLILNLEF